jgi:glycosyltransferase involved in cell wall biosynthesis
MTAPRVLHVLPHAGGGAETYLEQLEPMENFRFERLSLTRHRSPAEVPGGVARLARALRGHDLIHIHGDAAVLACWPVLRRRPTVITLHGSHLLRRASGLRGRFVRAGVRRGFRRACGVIAVSPSELAFARSVAPGSADRIELIENGVPDIERSNRMDPRSTREGLRIERGALVALFVGELSERKQPLQFAEAVQRARSRNAEIVGVLAGDGPLRSRLEPMRGDGLRLLGDRDDIEDLIAMADIFVLPSKWEGLSYGLLEAMALGKATVVSDGPGNRDAVGKTGLTFAVGNVAGMADSLLRLASEPDLRESLGEAAAARARERFSAARMRDSTARVYERCLDRSGER